LSNSSEMVLLLIFKNIRDGIFTVRQVQKKHQEKKNLYYAFVDLEKTFDRVWRKVMRWALSKSGVVEWLVISSDGDIQRGKDGGQNR
jgi:hypothetical protein